MNYSKWSNSFWYTFWKKNDSVLEKNKEIFIICDFGGTIEFTYKELKEKPKKCIEKVKKEYAKQKNLEILTEEKRIGDKILKKYERIPCYPVHLKENVLNELRKYIKFFIQDVETKYKT